MSFFKRASDGRVVFNGGKHDGESVDQVALSDPQYLRWARRDMTLGVPDDVFESISNAMIANGVPFTVPKKKP